MHEAVSGSQLGATDAVLVDWRRCSAVDSGRWGALQQLASAVAGCVVLVNRESHELEQVLSDNVCLVHCSGARTGDGQPAALPAHIIALRGKPTKVQAGCMQHTSIEALIDSMKP